MKAIFITREGYDQPGARIRCYGFHSELSKRGIEADVFSFADHLGSKAGKKEAKFSLAEKLRYTKDGFLHLAREKKCVFIVNRFNYHTISCVLASKLKGIPIIFDMDDWEAREDTGSYLGLFPKSKAEYLTRLTARNSKFCIAASKYLRQYLLKFNRSVVYIPTGVDTEKFRPAKYNSGRNFTFSWHGSVNRREILDYIEFLMKCFTSLRQKYDSIKFVIIGDGIFGRELRSLVKKHKDSGIDYLGWREADQVPEYLKNVNVGLVPLLHESKFNLSKCPVKLLEYMALGKPVIASPVGEARHIITNGYNGFLAADQDQFIADMQELIKDPTRAKRIGINAANSVKESYSLEVLGERLYQAVVNGFG